MNNGTGEKWEVINLPAIANDNNDLLNRNIGDPLRPDAYDREELEQIKKAVGENGTGQLYIKGNQRD